MMQVLSCGCVVGMRLRFAAMVEMRWGAWEGGVTAVRAMTGHEVWRRDVAVGAWLV